MNIYKADFSGLVRSYKYSEIPSPFYLAADKYRVDVIAGEAVSATPANRFVGQQELQGFEAVRYRSESGDFRTGCSKCEQCHFKGFFRSEHRRELQRRLYLDNDSQR